MLPKRSGLEPTAVEPIAAARIPLNLVDFTFPADYPTDLIRAWYAVFVKLSSGKQVEDQSSRSTWPAETCSVRSKRLLKLLQKLQVIAREEADIADTVTAHAEAFDPQAEGKAANPVGIVSDG